MVLVIGKQKTAGRIASDRCEDLLFSIRPKSLSHAEGGQEEPVLGRSSILDKTISRIR